MSLKLRLSTAFLLFNMLVFSLEALANDEREFDKESLEAFRHDPDFNYSQDYAPSDSLVTLMLTYLLSTFSDIFDTPNIQWIFPLLFRILLFGGIVVAVWMIVRLRYGKVLSKASRPFGGFAVANTGQQDEDYQRLLKESLANNQRKLAVRYLFLSALLLLEQQKCFRITKWKAPHDYLKELPEEKKAHFKLLTELFEKTWYGDYHPDSNELDEGLRLYRGLQDA